MRVYLIIAAIIILATSMAVLVLFVGRIVRTSVNSQSEGSRIWP